MLRHDSRDEAYRTPPGAGACASRITLRLNADEPLDSATLRLWWDEREVLEPMTAMPDGFYQAELTLPEHPGTLWYYFIAVRNGAMVYYGNAPDGLGGIGAEYQGEPPGYQITVYDPAFRAPEWMRNGLLYQIMVDRFRASVPVDQKPVPYRGWLHRDWHEPPALRNEPNGGDNEANDFFGGDLRGIREKLPYLTALGVTAIYLNPIFRARSNHKYDTGDYLEIDPSFGDEADFRALCADAAARGIRIILDGVFSHTGADSRYFNKRGQYDSIGAYQSQSSPYASWYTFTHWPDDYFSWWGFQTLPNVREMNESYLDFIIHGDDAVAAHWVRAGSSGWRLDVADELPMPFLRMLRTRVKAENPDATLLGEVWEDASNKLTYGESRNYTLGDTLDSVMNYPLRDGLLGFMMGHVNAGAFERRIAHLQENYAPTFFYSLMNMLGSHDKPRVIDVLSGVKALEPPRDERHARTLSKAQYRLGRRRFLALWQFVTALPGMPCLYYADEAGQTGMADPFCRATYPWGREDTALMRRVARINHLRLKTDALRTGDMRLYAPTEDVLVVARRIKNGRDHFGRAAKDDLILCALNRLDTAATVTLPADDWLHAPVTFSLGALTSKLIRAKHAR